MAQRSSGSRSVQLTQRSPFRRANRDQPNPSGALNRQQRLTRWVELLNRNPSEVLRLLPPSWCLTAGERKTLLMTGTALEVAYRDPILRLDGLKSPCLAHAMTFFGLSVQDADRILSASRYSNERTARDTIIRIRNVADKRLERRLLYCAIGAAVVLAAALSCLF